MKRSFFSGLLDMLFPPKCAFCSSVLKNGEKDFCAKCEKSLPYTSGEKCKQKGVFFELCVSPLYYQDEVRQSLLRYKFDGKVGYARGYARLIAKTVREMLAGKYDLITWVPLSEKREKKRGYDQAMLLAMALAVELNDVAVETLRKTQDIPAQSGIDNKEKRQANVLGVYEVVDTELIMGQKILVVDDIITTGSTLSECARVLRMAGAESVVCATIAKGR